MQLRTEKQLSEVDYMCIMNVANLCKDEEFGCDVDQVDAVRQQLIDQATICKQRLDEIDALFEEMHVENTKPEKVRDVDQLKETVRSIARLFMFDNSDNNYPDTGLAVGFSGERKGGGKTACKFLLRYDFLSCVSMFRIFFSCELINYISPLVLKNYIQCLLFLYEIDDELPPIKTKKTP